MTGEHHKYSLISVLTRANTFACTPWPFVIPFLTIVGGNVRLLNSKGFHEKSTENYKTTIIKASFLLLFEYFKLYISKNTGSYLPTYLLIYINIFTEFVLKFGKLRSSVLFKVT